MKPYQIIRKTLPFAIFMIGIWYFCIRVLGYNLEYIPGDLGDSRFINYILEHGYCWIRGDINDFWDGGFMYPFKNSIALSDNMLGIIPIYSIFRIFGFSPESSYQLWWMVICTLNYWISFFVFKKWFNQLEVALILAWIFAFSIFNLGQLNYMQMNIRFMIPVAFYAAYKMLNQPSIKYLSIYCFSVVYQIYCVSYTGIYLVYFSALFISIYYLISNKWKDLRYYFKKENVVYTLLVFFMSISAMLWVLLPYLKMSKVVGLQLYREVIINLPLWKSFLFPHESSITWRFLFGLAKPNVPEWWLHYLFIGVIPFMIMILSPFYLIYNWYKKTNTPLLLKLIIITSLVITLLHVRTENGYSLYALIFKLPGINSMRVLIRFMHVEILLLLLLFGYFLARIKNKYFLFFILLVFADNLFSPEYIQREKKAEIIERRKSILTELSKHDIKSIKAVALINSNEPAYMVHLDMMLVAQSVGVKSLNGYSSYCPDEFGEFFLKNSEEGLLKWINSQGIKRDEILIINTKK